MSNEIQGAITTEKPYTYYKWHNEYKIFFRGEEVDDAENLSEMTVINIVADLNKAFQLGFSEASNKLMNKD